MERIEVRTSVNRCKLFAALLAVVIASGSLGLAQRADDRAVERVFPD